MTSNNPVNLVARTPRLLLREWLQDDMAPMAEYFADPETMRFIGDGNTRTPDETAERIRRCMDHCRQHGFSLWAVVDRASGTTIGRCGLQYLPGTEEVEIGWLLGRPWWGRGLALEAARAALHAGFGHFQLPEICAVTLPGNERSIRLMHKLGMRHTGRERHYNAEVEHFLLRRGEWQCGERLADVEILAGR